MAAIRQHAARNVATICRGQPWYGHWSHQGNYLKIAWRRTAIRHIIGVGIHGERRMRFETDERGFLRVQQQQGGGLGTPVLVVLGLIGLFIVMSGRDSGATGNIARQAAVIHQYETVLRQRTLTPQAHGVHTDSPCSARFFTGELRTLVANTPCRSIRRAVFAATDARGNRVVVSIAWVGMPDQSSAAALAGVYRSGGGEVGVLPAPHVPVVSAPHASRSTVVHGNTAMLVGTNMPTRGATAQLLRGTIDELAKLPPL